MLFPEDQLRDDIKAEDHSFATIAVVAVVMIGAAMGSLVLTL
ncbi:MAG: hypothetical protein QNJ29_03810 [Rhizobiaceae bacterium]|nr:hypothetical protein [Rhizobiaceae bacterium]